MIKFTIMIRYAMCGMLFSTPIYADTQDEIVVTARSLKDTASTLKSCLDRGCPPDQDIAATLAHAENQFIEGDYRDARATLQASLGRNRKHKKSYPIQLSDLLRANGNIASQLGESDSYRISVLDMRDTLKNALSPNDYRVLGAELEVADSRLRLGYPDEARAKYRAIEERAKALKMPQVAAIAKIRELSSFVSDAKVTKDPYFITLAAEKLDGYISNPTPGAEKFAIVAQVLKSRLERSQGKTETTDALIKRYSELGVTGTPLLIHANPININNALAGRDQDSLTAFDSGSLTSNALSSLQSISVEKRWVDIGFWIKPDGKVSEAEILRNKGSTKWTEAVLKSIYSRIYTPSIEVNDTSNPGFYAVERYTMTADYTTDNTGTHQRRRSNIPKIERIDLSVYPEN
jgi:hypothetical protein